MKLELSITGILAAWYLIKRWTDEISKIVEPLITEAEKLAQDGTIDKADRKKLVMLAITNLEKDGKIKLNLITRFIISKVIDKIAAKLPDFTISANAQELLKNSNKKSP